MDLSDFNSVYFGVAGKKQLEYGIINGLGDQLLTFSYFLERLRDADVPMENPLDTMLENITKDYLIDFTKGGKVPVIPTQRVDSLDELRDLSRSDSKYIAKPLLSERAQGTVILNKLSDSELETYANTYLKKIDSPMSLYERLLNRQGIIVQPYQEDFLNYGEKKVAVVNGIPTLAKNNSVEGGELVTVDNGAKINSFDLTDDECDFVKNAYEVFNERTPASYMRVDFIGDGKNSRVNEIEAINPNYSTLHSFYSDELLSKHFGLILDNLVGSR